LQEATGPKVAATLAARWGLPASWLSEHARGDGVRIESGEWRLRRMGQEWGDVCAAGVEGCTASGAWILRRKGRLSGDAPTGDWLLNGVAPRRHAGDVLRIGDVALRRR
jgi:hypothetical protein